MTAPSYDRAEDLLWVCGRTQPEAESSGRIQSEYDHDIDGSYEEMCEGTVRRPGE